MSPLVLRGVVFDPKRRNTTDFEQIYRKDPNVLLVFNDNEEERLAWVTSRTAKRGGGNAAVRPLQLEKPQRVVGVPTGQAGKGYATASRHVKQLIVAAMDEARCLLWEQPNLQEVVYSRSGTTLGTGIFTVASRSRTLSSRS